MLDNRELNKVVLPICGAEPHITTILDTLAMVLGVREQYALYRSPVHVVLDLANAFISSALATESHDQFVFTWEGQQGTFQVLPEATCTYVMGW